jgi:serine/threonine protein kinase
VIGQEVGKYRIVDEIAEGGMGMVYRAEHLTLGSPAAIKILLPKFTVDPLVVQRFFTEAKATSAIRHVGIVDVYDFGMLPGGSAYIAMELLRGEPLSEFIERQRQIGPHAAIAITLQLLAALDAAHVIGIVHRDLKPDNIFLVPDAGSPGGVRVKVLDFGVAKLVSEVLGPRSKTAAGTVLGTPTYMAPEQCKGGVDIDHRADLYAVGCILYEMLTGAPPFVSHTGAGELLAMHIYQPAPRLAEAAPHLPPEADQIVAKMLAKHVGDRPPSAAWAMAALERIPLPDMDTMTLSRHLAVRMRAEPSRPTARPSKASLELAAQVGKARAASPTAATGGRAAKAKASRREDATQIVADDPGSRRLPIILFIIAVLIAAAAVVVIGRSGGDFEAPPLPPSPPPTVTPIDPGSR